MPGKTDAIGSGSDDCHCRTSAFALNASRYCQRSRGDKEMRQREKRWRERSGDQEQAPVIPSGTNEQRCADVRRPAIGRQPDHAAIGDIHRRGEMRPPAHLFSATRRPGPVVRGTSRKMEPVPATNPMARARYSAMGLNIGSSIPEWIWIQANADVLRQLGKAL